MKSIVTVVAGLLAIAAANAQGAVDVSAPGVRVQTGKGGPSVAVNTAGSIEEDVDMEGVAVINGDVFIDGEKIPRGKTSHKGKKSGKSYLIKWGKNGNVSVEEK